MNLIDFSFVIRRMSPILFFSNGTASFLVAMHYRSLVDFVPVYNSGSYCMPQVVVIW